MSERYADDGHRYRLDERIATGGMGEVWRATDTVLDRTVAVKLLKHEYADDAQFRHRFESEARHAGALHHPGIAGVFDFGEGGGGGSPRPYLVMEHVDGQPLSALLRPDAPMDPDVARDLMAQAADALAAAHAKGIVHRDVKPANLLVTPDRRVKVTDFGIARAADGVAITETGQVMGTPQYLSPEQARGERATAASDVYSLGVVAYQCLVGRTPFRGDSPITTALGHLRDPVPELPERVPADLAAVVRRALAKDPAQRFAGAAALAAAFRDPSSVEPATPAGPGEPVAAAADEPRTRVLDESPATSVLPAAGAGLAGAAAASAAGAAHHDDRARRRNPWTWAVWLGLGLLLALLVWAMVQSAADSPEDSAAPADPPSSAAPASSEPAPAESTQASAPPETTAPEEPAGITLDPGLYVGRDAKDVEKALRELDLDPQTEEVANDGSAEEDTVAGIAPTEGLLPGDEVTVQVYGDAPDDDKDNGKGKGKGDGGGGKGKDG